jgi:Ca-activated chloride channel family protein
MLFDKIKSCQSETIAKATKGGYVNEIIQKKCIHQGSLDNIQKNQFESTQIADFQSAVSMVFVRICFVVLDLFFV